MEAIIEKYGRGRVFLVCYCFFVIVLAIEILILYHAYNTLSYKGHKLRVQEVSINTVIISDKNDNRLTMTVEMNPSSFNKQYTIKYLTETILYHYKVDKDSMYKFSDGSIYMEPFIQVSYNGLSTDKSLNNKQKEEKRLIDSLIDYFYDYLSIGSFVILFIYDLLLLMLAHGLFFYPRFFWHLRIFLSVRGGEPTDLYIFTSKISSIMIIIFTYVISIVIL